MKQIVERNIDAVVKDFPQRVVLITGATTGAALLVARHFIEHSAKVVISGNNIAEGLAAFTSLGMLDRGDIAFIPGNNGSRDDCRKIVVQAVQFFGRIDIVINFAQAKPERAVAGYSPSSPRDENLENSLAGRWIFEYAVPEMQKNKSGVAINIVMCDHQRGEDVNFSDKAAKLSCACLKNAIIFNMWPYLVCVQSISQNDLAREEIGELAKHQKELTSLFALNRRKTTTEAARAIYWSALLALHAGAGCILKGQTSRHAS